MNQAPDRLNDQMVPRRVELDDAIPNRLFAIGEIHGCNVALKTLIEAIDPQPADTIVVLGDVIDWGPDLRDCICQRLFPENQFPRLR